MPGLAYLDNRFNTDARFLVSNSETAVVDTTTGSTVSNDIASSLGVIQQSLSQRD